MFTVYCQVVVAINICNVRAAMGIKLYVMGTHHSPHFKTCDMLCDNGYISVMIMDTSQKLEDLPQCSKIGRKKF